MKLLQPGRETKEYTAARQIDVNVLQLVVSMTLCTERQKEKTVAVSEHFGQRFLREWCYTWSDINLPSNLFTSASDSHVGCASDSAVMPCSLTNFSEIWQSGKTTKVFHQTAVLDAPPSDHSKYGQFSSLSSGLAGHRVRKPGC